MSARDAVTFTGDLHTLSPRQRQMLVDYASGLLVKQIADLRGVSERTVEYHLDALRAKLGVSLVQAVVMAAEVGWLRPAPTAMPKPIACACHAAPAGTVDDRLRGLTDIERAILVGVGTGHGTKALSRQVGKSTSAVSALRKRIAVKTGMPLISAVVLATKAGWL